MIRSSDVHISYLILCTCLSLFLGKWIAIVLGHLRFRGFAVNHGCLTGKVYKHIDPYFGLGLLLQIIQDYRARKVLQAWQENSIDIGHKFSFWLLGKRMFITSDPENVQRILASGFGDFDHGPTRRYAFGPLFGDGIFATDGAQWSEARALLRPSFARSQMCEMDMFEYHFENFLKALPAGEHVVDLQELFKYLSMDIITEMLFGSSMNVLMHGDDAEAMEFSHACEYSEKVAWRNVSLGWIGTQLPDRKDARSRQLLHNAVNFYVERVLQQETEEENKREEFESKRGKRYVFLDNLAKRTRDPKILRDQLISTLLGGRDTTSKLLSNLLHILARRPDIWAKLRAEALALGAQPLTLERLKNAEIVRRYLYEC